MELAQSNESSFGERMADRVAQVGGSWPFVIGLISLICSWISINILLHSKPFDPYPFILLNLFLSTLSAFQAPILMMSNNRQAQKDRDRDKMHFETSQSANYMADLAIHKLNDLIEISNYNNLRLQRLEENMGTVLRNTNR